MPLVLIVADDSGLRETLSSALANEGYSVEYANDGAEALARLHGGPKPDAILLNVMMANMSGWRFRAQQLNVPAFASIPTIVITATGNIARAAIAADDVLPRPVTPDQLLATLRRYVHVDSNEDDVKTNPRLRALSTEADTGALHAGGTVESPRVGEASWRLVPPKKGETCRWEDEATGRWISISIGDGVELGTAVVLNSSGERERFESYEDAIRFCDGLRKAAR